MTYYWLMSFSNVWFLSSFIFILWGLHYRVLFIVVTTALFWILQKYKILFIPANYCFAIINGWGWIQKEAPERCLHHLISRNPYINHHREATGLLWVHANRDSLRLGRDHLVIVTCRNLSRNRLWAELLEPVLHILCIDRWFYMCS